MTYQGFTYEPPQPMEQEVSAPSEDPRDDVDE